MGKMLALLLIILLALASVAGSLFLSQQITAGERQIANGQRELEEGKQALEEGKAELEAGKQDLSEGKKDYQQTKNNLLLVLIDKVLRGGKGFKQAKKQISEGDTLVAKGEDKVGLGESRFNRGELELRRGRDQVTLAKGARIACALWAVFFASLSIVLGFYWRQSIKSFISISN